MDILSYILGKKAGGGGGEAVLVNKDISANGTYNASADSADGYKKVEVSVPNTYAAGDEGKVVSNGALVAQGSDTVTANDTYDTTLISELTVNVSGGGGYSMDDIANRSFAVESAPFDVVIPAATRIPPYCFNRGNLKSVSAPHVAYFTHRLNDQNGYGGFVFEECKQLTSVSFPELVDVGSGGYTFSGCSALTTVYAPKCNYSERMFNGCTSLQNIALGYGRSTKVETGTFMFASCTNLKAVDLSNISKLNNNLIRDSGNADTLILRDSTVVACGSTYVFDNSRFKNGGAGGDIYIPKSLYDHLGDGTQYDYKAATNWATYDGYGTITWHAIEGSIYENAYADGTPIS